MKIAFDHQTFTLQKYGGVSRYFSRLAAALGQLGQTVGIFAPYYQNRYLDELPANMIYGQAVKNYPLQTKRLVLAYNHWAAKRAIQQWQPTIVHETYFSHKATTPPLCPTVVTIHDMIHELYPEHFYVWDKTSRCKKQAIQRAAHVICVSENTRQDVIRLLGIPEEKLSVVHHGIDHLSLPASQPHEDRPYLLYIGHRNGYKNFAAFVQAFAASRFLRQNFSIIAFGANPLSRQERLFITGQGLAETAVKQVNGDDTRLVQLYQNASAFIYPSLYEGFGIPPLEAMANHCPVIASNTSSIPEVLGDAAAYFDPLSLENMREVMEATLSCTQSLDLLKNKGSARARQFSWQRCAEETLAIYQKRLG